MSEQSLRVASFFSPSTPLEELVLSKMVRVLGQEKALTLLEETMTAVGLSQLHTVQELLGVSNVMIKGGGFPSVVGRSLKVYAILRGATE
jgi:hypothetical protein